MNGNVRGRPSQGKPRSPQELRRFGLVFACAFAVLGVFFEWRGREIGVYALAAATGISVLALVLPRILAPVERVWTALAKMLSAVATMVILTVAFFVVITPLGLLVRLLERDGMGLRLDRRAGTYWVPVDPAGPSGRPDKPF